MPTHLPKVIERMGRLRPAAKYGNLPRSVLPVEAAFLNGLGQVVNLNAVGTSQVGNGAGHFGVLLVSDVAVV